MPIPGYEGFDPGQLDAPAPGHVPIEPYKSMGRHDLLALMDEAARAGGPSKWSMLNQHLLDRLTAREAWVHHRRMQVANILFVEAHHIEPASAAEGRGALFGVADQFTALAADLLFPEGWGHEPYRATEPVV